MVTFGHHGICSSSIRWYHQGMRSALCAVQAVYVYAIYIPYLPTHLPTLYTIPVCKHAGNHKYLSTGRQTTL